MCGKGLYKINMEYIIPKRVMKYENCLFRGLNASLVKIYNILYFLKVFFPAGYKRQ